VGFDRIADARTSWCAERLIVEITETVAIQDIDDLRGFVTRLKNFGSRVAIDDFGAGYTSFRNLRKLGVNVVKIDGAFVQNVARSADDRAFVQTLIDLARRLQIKTVTMSIVPDWRNGETESYSFFGSFDMRSRRSCISFICRRRSSMLSSSGIGSSVFSGSIATLPLRGGTNGLNIENVC
jgi:hypothetical protein